jgi:hypothetical protein
MEAYTREESTGGDEVAANRSGSWSWVARLWCAGISRFLARGGMVGGGDWTMKELGRSRWCKSSESAWGGQSLVDQVGAHRALSRG